MTFNVPKGGGSFLPKQALSDLGYEKGLWTYYAQGVKEAETEFNKAVNKHNDRLISAAEKPRQKKSWWEVWR